jgi:hypothetical protein
LNDKFLISGPTHHERGMTCRMGADLSVVEARWDKNEVREVLFLHVSEHTALLMDVCAIDHSDLFHARFPRFIYGGWTRESCWARCSVLGLGCISRLLTKEDLGGSYFLGFPLQTSYSPYDRADLSSRGTAGGVFLPDVMSASKLARCNG